MDVIQFLYQNNLENMNMEQLRKLHENLMTNSDPHAELVMLCIATREGDTSKPRLSYTNLGNEPPKSW